MPLGELYLKFKELPSVVAFYFPLSNKALTGEEPGQQLFYAHVVPSSPYPLVRW